LSPVGNRLGGNATQVRILHSLPNLTIGFTILWLTYAVFSQKPDDLINDLLGMFQQITW